MIGIIVGMIVSAIWSAIVYRRYLGYRANPDSGTLFRRLYLIGGTLWVIFLGVITGGLINLVIWLFHL